MCSEFANGSKQLSLRTLTQLVQNEIGLAIGKKQISWNVFDAWIAVGYSFFCEAIHDSCWRALRPRSQGRLDSAALDAISAAASLVLFLNSHWPCRLSKMQHFCISWAGSSFRVSLYQNHYLTNHLHETSPLKRNLKKARTLRAP